ncbi:MAG: recombinase family protein, partial [Butyrivibrio sp.]|nr:recombinase family protein [Butyrivibrio sp.]
MPTVIAIPATRREVRKTNSVQAIRRKVVGYARVSTDHDEQLTSYEAQMEYYTRYIKEHDGWEYAGMYSDEGITATNTKNRDGFNQMVTDALAGKFNLIITKSVSRFAR